MSPLSDIVIVVDVGASFFKIFYFSKIGELITDEINSSFSFSRSSRLRDSKFMFGEEKFFDNTLQLCSKLMLIILPYN